MSLDGKTEQNAELTINKNLSVKIGERTFSKEVDRFRGLVDVFTNNIRNMGGINSPLKGKLISFKNDLRNLSELDDDELEKCMRQAHVETQKLKELVLPLQKEICRLKHINKFLLNLVYHSASDILVSTQSTIKKAFSSGDISKSYTSEDIPVKLISSMSNLEHYLNAKRSSLPEISMANGTTESLKSSPLLQLLTHPKINSGQQHLFSQMYKPPKRFSDRSKPRILWNPDVKSNATDKLPNNANGIYVDKNNNLNGDISAESDFLHHKSLNQINLQDETLLNEKIELETKLNLEQTKCRELTEKYELYAENIREKLAILIQQINAGESQQRTLRDHVKRVKVKLEQEVEELMDRMEEMQKKMVKIVDENNHLSGKHNIKSQKLQQKMINLPNNVEDLQIYLLEMQEKLIAAQIGKEVCEEKCALRIAQLESMLDKYTTHSLTSIESKSSSIGEERSSKNHTLPIDNVLDMDELVDKTLPSPLKPVPCTNYTTEHN